MPRLVAFTQVSLDGFFADEHGDMTWAKRDDDREFDAFVEENASVGGALVFGRVTYDFMASWWPTAAAREMAPAVAERMNALPKIVFSRTLREASWQNTRLVRRDPVAELRALKRAPGPDLAILGSGTIVSQAASAGLVDEFKVVVNPLVLGKGRSAFETVADRLRLRLTRTRTFRGGNVLLCYAPAR